MRRLFVSTVFLLMGLLCRRINADELRLSVVAKADKNLWILRDGETVRDGDRIALRVESDQVAYIYVVYIDRDGMHLIHPTEKPDQVAASVPRRIPIHTEDWLVVEGALPEHAQREDVLVIASPVPLGEAAALSRARVALASGTSPKPIKTDLPRKLLPLGSTVPPPPGILTDPGYRNLLVSHDSHVLLNKGSAVLRFSFWHH